MNQSILLTLLAIVVGSVGSFTTVQAQNLPAPRATTSSPQQPHVPARLNRELVALLAQIRERDQHDRQVAAEAEKTYGPNSPQVVAAMHRQGVVDIRLIRQVDSLIARHGYPGRSLVGPAQATTAFLVIQHSPDPKYLPLLTKAANQGELPWSSLALFIDRIRTERGENQVYGTQWLISLEGRKQLYPIENETLVNVRRAKVGLEPLEAYLRRNGLTYRVPTAGANPNPPALYVAPRAVGASVEKAEVELVGGYPALYAQLRYPVEAQQKQLRGHVTLQMTISPTGIPQEVAVVKSLGASCDEEAVRVMRAARYLNAAGKDHEIRVSLPFPFQPTGVGGK